MNFLPDRHLCLFLLSTHCLLHMCDDACGRSVAGLCAHISHPLLLPTLFDLGSLGHRSIMDGLIEGKVEPNGTRTQSS